MNVFSVILVSLATGTLPAAAIAGFFMFRVNRATAVKVLAEAEEISKRTALDEARTAITFLHEANESIKRDCDDCKARLTMAEERMRNSERRMQLSEDRLAHSEERGRRFQTALRAVVRVMDENDPTQIGAAIAAARELI